MPPDPHSAVLLIEPRHELRRSIADYLRTLRLTVIPAEDITTAFVLAAEVNVRVVIVAATDAAAVAAQMETLRRLPKLCEVIGLVDTPVAITGRRRRGQPVILPRPVDPKALRRAVMRAVRARRAAPPEAQRRRRHTDDNNDGPPTV